MARGFTWTVVLIVVLAGCSALPGPGTPASSDRAVELSIANQHDTRSVVRVVALPPTVDALELTYANGTTRRFDVASFDALPRPALRNATAVATNGSAARSEQFTVGPSEGFGTTLTAVPPNATVVYFVLPASGDDRVRGAGVARCAAGADTTDLAITIRPDGSLHTAVTCRDER